MPQQTTINVKKTAKKSKKPQPGTRPGPDVPFLLTSGKPTTLYMAEDEELRALLVGANRHITPATYELIKQELKERKVPVPQNARSLWVSLSC